MAIRRITASDIAWGQPLAWDVFSAPSASRPFFKKGDIVTPEQLEGWLESGLYADAGAPSSVLLHLNQINRALERMLLDLRDQGTTQGELRELASELVATVKRAPEVALACIFLNQIAGTYGVRHCTETAIVASLVASSMGKSDEEVLVVAAAAMTMNVGMLREAEQFHERDHALSHEERQLVLRHPAIGADKLRWAGVDNESWLELVLLHHENDDGSGYPHGRLGAEIAHNAKVIGLADRYCACVSARNYRKSLLPPQALARLREQPIDPATVDSFARTLGPYPPGTLVRLENGACGVVVSMGPAPQVHVLRPAQGEGGTAISEALPEDSAGLRFSMKQVWGDLAGV